MKKVFVCKELSAGETRTALVPSDVGKLIKKGFDVKIETGAGLQAGYSDAEYEKAGAVIAKSREEMKDAEIIVRIQKPDNTDGIPKGALHLSYMDPFNESKLLKDFASAGIRALSLEMIPRTTLAQAMDVQSSQASLAGYYASILAAAKLPKIFPMMMTPAGTISPAKVFVIGVGVAGLQIIATARRLGARVEAFDTRPVVEEQVKSLGAKFLKIDLGEMGQTEQGYAKELSAEQIAIQQKAQGKVCAQSDVVITTAKVFGRKAPILVTKEMLAGMAPGSIVIDMAVNTGGNVEGSDPNQDVVLENGVTIIGGDSLERFVPRDASNMFSGNITAFLMHFWNEETKELKIDMNDEIMAGALLTDEGKIVHPRFVEQ